MRAFTSLSRRLHILSLAAIGSAAILAFGVSVLEKNDTRAGRNVASPSSNGVSVSIPGLAYDGTPEPVPTPTPTPTPEPALLPAGPGGLRLWSDGDSTSYLVTVALFQEWAARGGIPVRQADYKISSGLWRPDFFDWPAYIAVEMAAYDPDVAVLMVGANDANQVNNHALYAERVGRVMDLMYRDGRIVVWVGQPCVDDASFAGTLPEVNRIFREQAAARSWVVYVDAWALTSWSDGTCAQYLPDENGVEQKLRLDDGIHLTPAGGRRIALGVIAALFAAE